MRIVVTGSRLTDAQVETVRAMADHLYGETLGIVHAGDAVRILATADAPVASAGGVVLATTGYRTGDDAAAAGIAAAALSADGDLLDQESIGGVHTAHASDGRRAVCWPSVPASGGLFHAAFGDGVLASNRPRLIAACIGARIDPRYLDYLIATGYPFDGTTPFEGVGAVRGHEALRLGPDGARIVRRRLRGVGRASRQEPQAVAADAAYRTELRRAVRAVAGFDAVELRLSGGKDSRLIGAALHAEGLRPLANTRGEGADRALARPVADRLGLDHVETNPRLDDRPLEARTLEVLTMSDGLVETETHTAMANRFAERLPGQDAIIYGQSGLQKGAWARMMSQGKGERGLAQVRAATVPAWIREGPAGRLRAEVDAVVDAFDYPTGMDVMFFPYAVLRAGRYLEPLYAKIESRFTPLFPLNDERVYVACSSLNRFRRTREMTVHDAIETWVPGLAALPTTSGRWRFEDADAMSPPPPPKRSETVDRLRAAFVRDVETARAALRGAPILERARGLLHDEALQRCGLIDGAPGNAFPKLDRRQTEKLILRLWFAHVLETRFATDRHA